MHSPLAYGVGLLLGLALLQGMASFNFDGPSGGKVIDWTHGHRQRAILHLHVGMEKESDP